MPEIRLALSKEFDKQIKKYCKRWFPREAYGVLLGTITGDLVFVDNLWFPPDQDAKRCFKPGTIFVETEWLHDIEDECGDGIRIVGDFHSHPYVKGETRYSPVLSAYDLDHLGDYPIYGVCNVEQQQDDKLRTRMRWWGPSVKVRLE